MLWMRSPLQVKTLRHFTADDPWNGTPRTSFRLEAAWGGFAPAYAVAEQSVPKKYAIVSDASGKRHALPDVLAGLWLSRKLQAENLPALLKALEPSLNRFDYIAHLSLTLFQRRVRLWLGPVVGFLILLLTVSITIFEPEIRLRGLTGDILTYGCLAAAVFGGVPGLPMWLLDRRRRKQVELVLALPGEKTGVAAPTAEVRWLSRDDAKNPFTVDGYDCLAFVRAMRSTTADKDVAAKFVALRSSVGGNHAGQMPVGATAIEHRLVYPCGEIADGVLFKAQQMEQKWDVYLYGGSLYFCRSWTDLLVFAAKFSATTDGLVVETIWAAAEALEGGRDHAVRQVDYLIKSLLFRRALPHPLPATLSTDPQTIGLYSFSQYGNLCCFGTYADTLRGDLAKPRSPNPQ